MPLAEKNPNVPTYTRSNLSQSVVVPEAGSSDGLKKPSTALNAAAPAFVGIARATTQASTGNRTPGIPSARPRASAVTATAASKPIGDTSPSTQAATGNRPAANAATGPRARVAPKAAVSNHTGNTTAATQASTGPRLAGSNLDQIAGTMAAMAITGSRGKAPPAASALPQHMRPAQQAQLAAASKTVSRQNFKPPHLRPVQPVQPAQPGQSPVPSTTTSQQAGPTAQPSSPLHTAALVPQIPSAAPAPAGATVVANARASTYHGSILSSVQAPNVHHLRPRYFSNGVCTLGPYNEQTFEPGDVISGPFHSPNLDKHLDKSSKDLTISAEDFPIFSKRRMFVVLFKSKEQLYAVPLYSWNSTGITKKIDKHIGKRDPKNKIHDYVEVVNFKHVAKFKQQGVHPPLQFVHRDPNSELTEFTTCHVLAGHMMDFKEDITRIGRLTEGSFNDLIKIREERESYYMKESKRKSKWPKDGEIDPRLKLPGR